MVHSLGPSVLHLLGDGLNSLQLHLSLQDPTFTLPVSSLRSVGPTSAEVVFYHSDSSDFMRNFLEGIMIQAARLFCGVQIAIKRQDTTSKGEAGTGSDGEEIYLVTFPVQSETGGTLRCCEAFLSEKQQLRSQANACAYAPSPALFYQMFPFHFLLDQKCHLIQVCVVDGLTIHSVDLR